jgi:hypothetical protein
MPTLAMEHGCFVSVLAREGMAPSTKMTAECARNSVGLRVEVAQWVATAGSVSLIATTRTFQGKIFCVSARMWKIGLIRAR